MNTLEMSVVLFLMEIGILLMKRDFTKYDRIKLGCEARLENFYLPILQENNLLLD